MGIHSVIKVIGPIAHPDLLQQTLLAQEVQIAVDGPPTDGGMLLPDALADFICCRMTEHHGSLHDRCSLDGVSCLFVISIHF